MECRRSAKSWPLVKLRWLSLQKTKFPEAVPSGVVMMLTEKNIDKI
jgi:hypothetical protein